MVRDLILLVAAAGATAAATPLAMRLAWRVGLVDRPSPTKFHQRPLPYLGGLAIFVVVLIGLIGSMLAEPGLRLQLVVVAVGGTAVAGIGLLDDWLVLAATPRLLVQALAAVALFEARIGVNPTGVPVLDLAITVAIVLTVTNAVNLLDNMDGLSAGTVGIACVCVGIAAEWQGQRLVSVMAVGLAGACLGFLPYNFHPARIFLGDAGTLFMGFLLSLAVLKLNLVGYPLVTRATVPLLMVAVPLFDMALVVISRARAGRRVFRGNTDHSSHRLVALGASIRGAALITYGAAGLSGLVGLLLLRARNPVLTMWVAAVAAATGVSLLVLFERVQPARFLKALHGGAGHGPAPEPSRVGALAGQMEAGDLGPVALAQLDFPAEPEGR